MSKSIVAVLAVSALVAGGSVIGNFNETDSVTKTLTAQDSEPSIGSIKKAASAPMKPESRCHASYSGCLKPNSGDYDCQGGSGNGPNYTGPVQVIGPDVFDLDRDNDGRGCDS